MAFHSLSFTKEMMVILYILRIKIFPSEGGVNLVSHYKPIELQEF